MEPRFNMDVLEQMRQNQIDSLLSMWEGYCSEKSVLKRELAGCNDTAARTRISRKLAQLEEKKKRVKQRLLQYGVKVETRGRPPLPPDHPHKTKITLRCDGFVIELFRQLKRDRVIDSYSQFVEFLVRCYKLQLPAKTDDAL